MNDRDKRVKQSYIIIIIIIIIIMTICGDLEALRQFVVHAAFGCSYNYRPWPTGSKVVCHENGSRLSSGSRKF